MKLVPMRYKGVEWHHNPREITFECDKKLNELKSPYGQSYIQNIGRKNMKISGTGELYGGDCLQQFDSLLKLFKQGGGGVLSLPKLSPIYAEFESLKIIGEPKPDALTYSFVFREVMDKKHSCKKIVCITKEGENLWDISYRYGIDIDSLVTLNPHIKRPDIVEDGSVIRLC
nr:MAG TPA: LysM [Caudoviricetes sp.]